MSADPKLPIIMAPPAGDGRINPEPLPLLRSHLQSEQHPILLDEQSITQLDQIFTELDKHPCPVCGFGPGDHFRGCIVYLGNRALEAAGAWDRPECRPVVGAGDAEWLRYVDAAKAALPEEFRMCGQPLSEAIEELASAWRALRDSIRSAP